jgi:predicted dehydrogenase
VANENVGNEVAAGHGGVILSFHEARRILDGRAMQTLALLGTGLVGQFYAESLLGGRRRDRIGLVYSHSAERAQAFAARYGIPRATCDLAAATAAPEVGVVVIGLPNDRHREAAELAAAAGKAVLCTKPLARSADEARAMLAAVERAGVFHGYLEDLVYTPKTLKALQSVAAGSIGKVLWARSREAHGGPHSAWFWDRARSGGGAIVDLGCHCIEIARRFIGSDVRPLEVTCWADTQAHPIEAEDHAVGLVRYESGALGQFEVSWAFRGGMDLRDEVTGTEGTIWLNHWLRTGFELFSSGRGAGYVAEKAEGGSGWLFPVGDEIGSLGYTAMFADMLDSLEAGRAPAETFYDGYVVNAIMDAAYRAAASKRWEKVQLDVWRGREGVPHVAVVRDFDAEHALLKEETMPDGTVKLLLRHKASGRIVERRRE